MKLLNNIKKHPYHKMGNTLKKKDAESSGLLNDCECQQIIYTQMW